LFHTRHTSNIAVWQTVHKSADGRTEVVQAESFRKCVRKFVLNQTEWLSCWTPLLEIMVMY